MYFEVDHFCLVVYVCGIVFTSLCHPHCHVLAHPFQLFVLYVRYHFRDILVLSIRSSSDLIWWLSTTTRLVSVWERYTHFRLVHTRLTHNFGFNTQNLFAQCVKCKKFEMVLLVHKFFSWNLRVRDGFFFQEFPSTWFQLGSTPRHSPKNYVLTRTDCIIAYFCVYRS